MPNPSAASSIVVSAGPIEKTFRADVTPIGICGCPEPGSAEPGVPTNPAGPVKVAVFTGIAVKPLFPRNVSRTFKPTAICEKLIVPTDSWRTGFDDVKLTGGVVLDCPVVHPQRSPAATAPATSERRFKARITA